MMCLGLDFCGFVLFFTFWICWFISVFKSGKFSVIISPSTFSALPFLLCFWDSDGASVKSSSCSPQSLGLCSFLCPVYFLSHLSHMYFRISESVMSAMYLVIFFLKSVPFSASRVLARDPDNVGIWGRLPQLCLNDIRIILNWSYLAMANARGLLWPSFPSPWKQRISLSCESCTPCLWA